MNGSIGERGQVTQDFAKKLEEATNVKVILWDERLTTIPSGTRFNPSRC